MFYSDEILSEVRSRNNIVDVIGSYVHLTKKGGNYFGLCPFHNEKSGSFCVSPVKNTYHCFGCGKGGNVFTFMMEYENLSFPEAVEVLAKRAGVDLPKQEYTPEMKRARDEREALLAIHKDAAVYYHKMLRSEAGKTGYAYFRKRALSDETIRNFGLGYSSQRPDALYRYLKEQGYRDAELKESGLFTYRERGVSDRFWNRVMFPIMDVNNRVIAFGGRVMGDGEPKYLNSPETKIFDKSRNLYGLNTAKRSRAGFLLICEGYMDVIAMHQAGFTNAVASLGTAFTSMHGQIMKRYTDEVILCYDNDGAGRKAILRAIPILKGAGLRMKVLDLSPYKDPDEFMKNLGKEAFQERIDHARNAFLFEIDVLRSEFDFEDPEQKSRFFHEAAKKLAAFTDEIERNSYIETVANQYGVDFQVLKRKVVGIGEVSQLKAASEEDWKPKKAEGRKKRDSGRVQAEKLILTNLAEHPETFSGVQKILTPEDFSDDLMKEVAALLFAQLRKDQVDPAGLLDHFIDGDRYNEVSGMFSSRYGADLSEEERRTAYIEAVRTVKRESLETEKAACQDPMRLMELLREIQELQRKEILL